MIFNLEIGAHVKSNLCHFIRAFKFESSYKSDLIPSPKRSISLNACTTCSELPSNISTMYLSFYSQRLESIMMTDRLYKKLPKVDLFTAFSFLLSAFKSLSQRRTQQVSRIC